MRRVRGATAWLGAILSVLPAQLAAQGPPTASSLGSSSFDRLTRGGEWPLPWTPDAGPIQAEVGSRTLAPMLLSLGVPGVGQLALEQRRGWAYLTLEALGWVFYAERRGAGGDYRNRYRDLAWNEARLQAGARVDGAFSYYETLSHWARSGTYDSDPGASGLQPESDPTSFNGSIWARAVGIFLPGGSSVPVSDPAYEGALGYYRDRAYSSGFLWDWTGTGTAQDDFAELIEESDDRFRQATNVLGAILANHVLSSVDAYLGARGISAPLGVRAAPAPRWSGARWSGWLHVPLPR